VGVAAVVAAVVMTMRTSKMAAIAMPRDRRTRQAYAACLASVKDLITGDMPPLNPALTIGRVADSEWIWFVGTVVWTWIATRAAQAADEGWNEERTIRATGLDPDPWTAGAIESILPHLPDACADLDWSKPVDAWTKDEVVEFTAAAIALTRRAVAARNVAEEKLAGKRPEAADPLLDEFCPFDGAPV
jgi:hypothetical protein